jgi:hypothetical protein
MADKPPARCLWRVLEALDYWRTQARVWVASGVRPRRRRLIGNGPAGLVVAYCGHQVEPDPAEMLLGTAPNRQKMGPENER